MQKYFLLKKDITRQWILEVIKNLLVVLSVLAVLSILVKACRLPWDISPNGFSVFVQLYSNYSILFAATFVVINMQLVIEQQNNTQTENEKKWNAERTNASLVQCQYYLNDIQIAFMNFRSNSIHDGTPIVWGNLSEISRKGLKEAYPDFLKKFHSIEKQTFREGAMLLYKLDAFAATFIHGITDSEVGRNTIGYLYCQQVGALMGFIAYCRIDTQLYRNILQLRDTWNEGGVFDTEIIYDD